MDSSNSTILRIEHPETGEGPYGPTPSAVVDTPLEALYARIDIKHNDKYTHPGLSRMYRLRGGEKTGRPLREFYSGFENAEQAFTWFGRSDLELLIDCGFSLLAFDVKAPVLRDGLQVAFLREEYEPVDSGWGLIGLS